MATGGEAGTRRSNQSQALAKKTGDRVQLQPEDKAIVEECGERTNVDQTMQRGPESECTEEMMRKQQLIRPKSCG